MRKYLVILSLLISSIINAQSPARDFDSTFLTNLGTTFNGRVHVPIGFYSQPTWKWDGIIFFVGQGEIGTSPALMQINGPSNYLKSGWNGIITVNTTQTKSPVIVTLQEPSFYHPQQMERVVDSVISNLHMFPGNVHLCGISLGSQVANQLVMYQNVNGVSLYGGKIRSIVNVVGEKPDQYGTGLAYAACFAGWAATGGREAAFEQAFDFRDLKTIVDTLNYTLNKSYYFQTNYGGGGHCCWKSEYGDSTGSIPLTYNFGGRIQDVYQWMLTQGLDTNATFHTFSSTPPICSAGPDTGYKVQLPVSTISLTGTASGTNGATIVSTLWSVLVNPTGATASVSSPNNLTTNITGLTKAGNYVFQLVATDNNGLKDTSTVRINTLPICNLASPITYIIGANSGASLDLDANNLPWKGGDTVRLVPGWYPFITIQNFTGDACRPIFVDFTGVRTKAFSQGTHTQYVHWYNLEVDTGSTQGSVFGQIFNHITYDHFKIKSNRLGGSGFFLKTSYNPTNPETVYPNYKMVGLRITGCNIDSSVSEAMYLGTTDADATDPGQPPFPTPRGDSAEIDHDTITNSGWDGIQLSGFGDGNRIHDNIIINYAVANMGSQQAGIIMGGHTKGEIDHNNLFKGTGNGIQAFNHGVALIHDNNLDSTGVDGTSNGQEAILIQDNISRFEILPPQKDSVYNNTILHARPNRAAIHSYNDHGSALAMTAYNNIICIPTGVNPTGIPFYIIGSPTPILSNNSIINTCSSIKPTVNAGSNQIISLPISSTILIGLAVGNGGATIVTTTWTQISGPNSSIILTPSNTTTVVSNFIQGVYTFQLQATDNNSNTNTSQIIVTVNSAIISAERNYFIHRRYRDYILQP